MERYIRQTLLDQIGVEGQQKLLDAHITIVGCGGLGSIAAPYLAGAGVGHITLIDGDIPDRTNLHRQVFFSDEIGSLTKSQELANHISQLNPEIKLTVHDKMISKSNIECLINKKTLVLECTDNIQVKYLVNDYCHIHQLPMVYGAIHKYDGYVSFFENDNSSSIHLRDIFAEPNIEIPSCSEVGVLGPLAGIIGLFQASEAIKHIAGAGTTLSNTLLTYNLLTNDQMKLRLQKTYTADLIKVYKNTNYFTDLTCEINEISISEVKKHRSAFNLISILEDHEHRDIDNHVIRMPLSEFEKDALRDLDPKKKNVFYCISGQRSATLLAQLDGPGLSLKGGLKSISK